MEFRPMACKQRLQVPGGLRNLFLSLLKELPVMTFSFFLWTLLSSTGRRLRRCLRMKLNKRTHRETERPRVTGPSDS